MVNGEPPAPLPEGGGQQASPVQLPSCGLVGVARHQDEVVTECSGHDASPPPKPRRTPSVSRRLLLICWPKLNHPRHQTLELNGAGD